MSQGIINIAGQFRQSFSLPSREVLRWFPGHMYKGMERIQATLKDIDCVVEVHDARIPFSGRNPRFRDIMSIRPHVLLLNKSDLANLSGGRRLKIRDRLKADGVNTVYFTDLRQFQRNRFVKSEILPKIIELTESRPRVCQNGLPEYNILVIGVPNVGKSTFINTVRWANLERKGRASAVGAIAGITRGVTNKIKVKDSPLIYVVDTPGIFLPSVPDVETGMRLSLCACLPDTLVQEETIADFLLFKLNQQKRFSYVKHFDLKGPSDDILEILAQIAVKNRLILRRKDISTNTLKYMPDFNEAARIMVRDFRKGGLGKWFFDDDKLIV